MTAQQLHIPGIYRHFKGNLYLTQDIVYHADTGEKMVTYRALYGNHRIWCRSVADFLSPVDHQKYPQVKQKFRFEHQVFPRCHPLSHLTTSCLSNLPA